ncbi:MAG TPA: cytochrome P450 [Acidimicrobiia bacterium]|nr:cytochrome P450 [Acidimicrobiia bacterium]
MPESVTLKDLEGDPHPLLARLRAEEPVAWVPTLDGWLVTRRDLCVEVMRDPVTFTVDDPRFSTAQVVGPSMLSLDGDNHARHRDPFAAAFRNAEVQSRFAGVIRQLATDLIDRFREAGRTELRRQLAGPLAVQVMTEALSLVETDSVTLLGWYDAIVAAVDRISAGQDAGEEGAAAFQELALRVNKTVANGRGLLAESAARLSIAEVASNAAVMLFGGVETAEGMTVNALWHLLTNPSQLAEVREDQELVAAAVEESLRLEPAAGRVDRYATRPVDLGGATIAAGDLVIVSISAANRDPETFPDPDRFDPHRGNVRSHLTFAQGPHACVGLHLARLETVTAIEVALQRLPGLAIDLAHSAPPRGLVFRKVPQLWVTWEDPADMLESQ